MALTRAATAALLFLSACGPDTVAMTDGSTGTATTGDVATLPTGEPLPEATTLQLSFSPIKQFDFTWSPAAGADHYRLLERITADDDHIQLGQDIVGTAVSVTMPLHLRLGASYIVQACNAGGCTDSEPLEVADSMAAAVGYFKASNSEAGDSFGYQVALSADGNTLVIGARTEDSDSNGIDGDQGNNAAETSGAVYVFVRTNNAWSQQAYLKASNSGVNDYFGSDFAVSADGNTLAVGASGEDSAGTGIDGDQNKDAPGAGAVYVFARVDGAWSQQAYLKGANTDTLDLFGYAVAISSDGNTLVVGAQWENAGSAILGGAVYVFGRAKDAGWSQQAYLKAPIPDDKDLFGAHIALSADGTTLAIAAPREASNATGIGGDQANDDAPEAGAVYVFVRTNTAWTQQAYLKASNTDPGDRFGAALALSSNGHTLAVGAYGESSRATGSGGDQTDNSVPLAGAVYVFARTDKAWCA